MRRSIVYALAVALLASCTKKEIDFQAPVPGHTVFHAYFERPSSETKVYATEDLLLRWHADDRVSIFNQNSFNQLYKFIGKTGDNSGDFSIVEDPGATPGASIPNVVSVYPYLSSTSISESQVLTITLPTRQAYAKNTFGLGADTMVSVSEDNFLQYKSIGGFLMLKLYGEGVSVSSITLRGNNGEKLAGKASVTMPLNGVPTAMMANDADTQITLTCVEPVPLGATEEESTQFWFVVPPLTFSKGFTISVIDSKDGTFEQSTSKSITIERNHLSRMSPMEVAPSYGFVPFEDERFKAYCLYNFDMNDDGKLSFEEAKDATEIDVDIEQISSLRGIEYFANLTSLKCNYNKLTHIDLSHNKALESLDCYNNQLTSLDISQNTALTSLQCGGNQLTCLDVSNNTALWWLGCDNNQLANLDVSNNPALVNLSCTQNRLSNLDVSNNPNLLYLKCYNNQLTSLDVSKNTKLTYLACEDNQLTNLDISENSKITYLNCARNQLTSIDVSNLNDLSILCCFDNELTGLDVSNNVRLENFDCGNNRLTNLDVSNNVRLIWLYCENNLFTSLDVSNNTKLQYLWCPSSPYLTEIWLQIGQTIEELEYDSDIATIKYKPEAVDLGLSVKWASFNLGASSPEQYGDYYAWGELEPYYSSLEPLIWKEGKEAGYTWSSYQWCMGNNNSLTKYCSKSMYGYNGYTDERTELEPEDDVAHIKLGKSWRIPSEADWTDLLEKCTWTWTTLNGVEGVLITSKENGNSIFLPPAGTYNGTTLEFGGNYCFYGASTLTLTTPYYSFGVYFDSEYDDFGVNKRTGGFPIRPVYAE